MELILGNIFGVAFVGGLLSFLWYRIATVRWKPLADVYANGHERPRTEKRFQNVIIHGVGVAYQRYSAITAFGVTDSGITLRLQGPLAAFHPPLFIPFTDISVAERKWFLIRAFELTANRAPEVKMVIYPHLFEWISETAGAPWRVNPRWE